MKACLVIAAVLGAAFADPTVAVAVLFLVVFLIAVCALLALAIRAGHRIVTEGPLDRGGHVRVIEGDR